MDQIHGRDMVRRSGMEKNGKNKIELTKLSNEDVLTRTKENRTFLDTILKRMGNWIEHITRERKEINNRQC